MDLLPEIVSEYLDRLAAQMFIPEFDPADWPKAFGGLK